MNAEEMGFQAIRAIETKVIEAGRFQSREQLADILKESANCLAQGGLVAFPTETVYGLGADALSKTAAAGIYAAKGRPSDNPLIVHIADIRDMERLAYVDERARMLAHAFWPGPLTIILPKKNIVPKETTGGLDTVAIRMPSHPVALSLIQESGVYVAAPSANLSGRPSPTTAAHVFEDMNGRIEYIIDGGPVGIGIESTIVDVTGETPTILRPGFITKQMLTDIIGKVIMDPALEEVEGTIKPKAPGMKYTHYAPKGELTLVEAAPDRAVNRTALTEKTALSGERRDCETEAGANAVTNAVAERIRGLAEEKRKAGHIVGIMAAEETISLYRECADVVICVGKRESQDTVAARLYAALRDFDEQGVEFIYAEGFCGDGLSYAIMNRLLKAAGHRVIYV